MEYRRLGSTGMYVSEISYGNWITHGSQVETESAIKCVREALNQGITTFDTADVYANTKAEVVLAKALKGVRRESYELFTKVYWPTGPGKNDRGLSRKHIMESCHASLKRLNTDHIDLYQVHSWDTNTRIDETLTALEDLVKSGKVRYVGCSNFLAYQLARSIGRAEVLGLTGFESVQPRYNMLFRDIERELLPLCEDDNIAVIPYNPLAGGFLTGKHLRGNPTEGGRFTLGYAAGRYQARYWHEHMFDTVDQLREIANETGVSLATLAVQWVLANKTVTSPIIGASRPEQLADAVIATQSPMSPDIKKRVDELTHDYRFVDDAR